MEKFRLGRTELMVSRSGFGAIPIQRISFDESRDILIKAYENGINYFDTARSYTDSEEKLGYALSDVRKNIFIATKTGSKTAEGLVSDLETSLKNLKTDYIDVYQFHNPKFVIDENHELYQAALKAKKEGKIRFISVTSHRLDFAKEMVKSGIFDTMQFPVSALSSDEDFDVVKLCKEHDIGFVAMKAMSGGLITNPTATFAYLRSFGNIIPIWGIQHMWELEQFLELEKNPPILDDALMETIKKDRAEISGSFCRACGYCMPTCPAKIEISTAARMSLLLGRMNIKKLVAPESQQLMEKIKDCIDCGVCKTYCPYGLDTPNLLKSEYDFYQKFITENGIK